MAFSQPKYDRPLAINRFFNPQSPGEKLIGSFLGTDVEQGKYGPQATMGVKDVQTGFPRTFNIGPHLDAELRRLRPNVGQGLVIEFKGEDVEGKKGKVFAVALDARFDDSAKLAAEALLAGSPPATVSDDVPF
jgi:hypothetical protein